MHFTARKAALTNIAELGKRVGITALVLPNITTLNAAASGGVMRSSFGTNSSVTARPPSASARGHAQQSFVCRGSSGEKIR